MKVCQVAFFSSPLFSSSFFLSKTIIGESSGSGSKPSKYNSSDINQFIFLSSFEKLESNNKRNDNKQNQDGNHRRNRKTDAERKTFCDLVILFFVEANDILHIRKNLLFDRNRFPHDVLFREDIVVQALGLSQKTAEQRKRRPMKKQTTESRKTIRRAMAYQLPMVFENSE